MLYNSLLLKLSSIIRISLIYKYLRVCYRRWHFLKRNLSYWMKYKKLYFFFYSYYLLYRLYALNKIKKTVDFNALVDIRYYQRNHLINIYSQYFILPLFCLECFLITYIFNRSYSPYLYSWICIKFFLKYMHVIIYLSIIYIVILLKCSII